ncbi:MAG: formylglycine-generating enzyme family protein [Elainellaceae cyanobacterium]
MQSPPKPVIHRYRRKAQYFTEDLGNGVSLDMVYIQGGTFMMGSPKDEIDREDYEGDQHQVTVQPFFMGKFPVTQAQYEAVIGKNPATQYDGDRFVAPNKPVVGVNWHEAVAFCDAMSEATGRDYRLPSEAEWEYACRADTTTPFHFGETISTDLANYQGTDDEDFGWSGSYGRGEKGIFRNQTTEVGSFGVANDFGLYDMHGNVWEWCLDHWHNDYEGAPTDGGAWIEEEGGDRSRMLRGGSWNYLPRNCRSAYRN